MILVFHLVSLVISASRVCTVNISNITMKFSGLGEAQECTSISFYNITKPSNDWFISTSGLNPTEDTTISIIDSNITGVAGFLDSNTNHDVKRVTLYINNTHIHGFCNTVARVQRIVFTDCVINMSEFSPSGIWILRCGEINFLNCEFVGKILDDESFIHLTDDDKIKQYYISFVGCRFNMDRDWRGSEVTGRRNLIFIADQKGRFAQVDFTRCTAGYNLGTTLQLIKMSSKEVNGNSVVIQGNTNGIAVQGAWVRNDDYLSDESNWTTFVNNDGYNPTPTPNPDSTPVPTPDNRDTFDKIDTWKIMRQDRHVEDHDIHVCRCFCCFHNCHCHDMYSKQESEI